MKRRHRARDYADALAFSEAEGLGLIEAGLPDEHASLGDRFPRPKASASLKHGPDAVDGRGAAEFSEAEGLGLIEACAALWHRPRQCRFSEAEGLGLIEAT